MPNSLNFSWHYEKQGMRRITEVHFSSTRIENVVKTQHLFWHFQNEFSKVNSCCNMMISLICIITDCSIVESHYPFGSNIYTTSEDKPKIKLPCPFPLTTFLSSTLALETLCPPEHQTSTAYSKKVRAKQHCSSSVHYKNCQKKTGSLEIPLPTASWNHFSG